jgi:predicted amidophosphoribosyltransferase
VRQLHRSRHPAESLADELGRRWQLELAGLLARTAGAERQATLPRARRRANVQGSFRAVTAAPPRILLVDDIYTTGATASAAASALRSAGARAVSTWSPSRGPSGRLKARD